MDIFSLENMGFPPSFVKLLQLGLSSVQFSFILNGEEFGKLAPNRGT